MTLPFKCFSLEVSIRYRQKSQNTLSYHSLLKTVGFHLGIYCLNGLKAALWDFGWGQIKAILSICIYTYRLRHSCMTLVRTRSLHRNNKIWSTLPPRWLTAEFCTTYSRLQAMKTRPQLWSRDRDSQGRQRVRNVWCSRVSDRSAKQTEYSCCPDANRNGQKLSEKNEGDQRVNLGLVEMELRPRRTNKRYDKY